MNINGEPCSDPIIEANVYQLRERSRVGVAKYGKTLAENPAEVWERLEHLKQELMDGINYITWVQSGIRPDA